MNIAAITSSYPRTPADHSGRFVAEWVDAIRTQHNVDVFCWADRGESVPGTTTVRYGPKRFERIFFGAGGPENLERERHLQLLFPSLFSSMIGAVARRGPYDLIVGHWAAPGGLAARTASRLMNVPSLVVCHSGGVHALKKRPILRNFAGRGPTTACSTAQLKYFPNARVLPMGFTPVANSELGSDALLIMSRLVPIKNVERILADMQSSDTEVHVAGDGPCRERLERIANASTTFHGFVDGEQKAELFRRCGYFASASSITQNGRHEGMPISLLEVIDAGLTPLVAPFPGLSDVLADELVVGPNESFLDRLRSTERKSYAHTVLRYRWENLKDSWLSVIEWAAGV